MSEPTGQWWHYNDIGAETTPLSFADVTAATLVGSSLFRYVRVDASRTAGPAAARAPLGCDAAVSARPVPAVAATAPRAAPVALKASTAVASQTPIIDVDDDADAGLQLAVAAATTHGDIAKWLNDASPKNETAGQFVHECLPQAIIAVRLHNELQRGRVAVLMRSWFAARATADAAPSQTSASQKLATQQPPNRTAMPTRRACREVLRVVPLVVVIVSERNHFWAFVIDTAARRVKMLDSFTQATEELRRAAVTACLLELGSEPFEDANIVDGAPLMQGPTSNACGMYCAENVVIAITAMLAPPVAPASGRVKLRRVAAAVPLPPLLGLNDEGVRVGLREWLVENKATELYRLHTIADQLRFLVVRAGLGQSRVAAWAMLLVRSGVAQNLDHSIVTTVERAEREAHAKAVIDCCVAAPLVTESDTPPPAPVVTLGDIIDAAFGTKATSLVPCKTLMQCLFPALRFINGQPMGCDTLCDRLAFRAVCPLCRASSPSRCSARANFELLGMTSEYNRCFIPNYVIVTKGTGAQDFISQVDGALCCEHAECISAARTSTSSSSAPTAAAAAAAAAATASTSTGRDSAVSTGGPATSSAAVWLLVHVCSGAGSKKSTRLEVPPMLVFGPRRLRLRGAILESVGDNEPPRALIMISETLFQRCAVSEVFAQQPMSKGTSDELATEAVVLLYGPPN